MLLGIFANSWSLITCFSLLYEVSELYIAFFFLEHEGDLCIISLRKKREYMARRVPNKTHTHKTLQHTQTKNSQHTPPTEG
jgi:hypothetical protein